MACLTPMGMERIRWINKETLRIDQVGNNNFGGILWVY
jgi:hypothetical protein